MAVRPIDGDALLKELTCNFAGDAFHGNRKVTIGEVRRIIESMPTLTQPNEGAKGKNVPANEPHDLGRAESRGQAPGVQAHKGYAPKV